MEGIARVVRESSDGFNIPKPTRNTITRELEVHVYDWVEFFRSLDFETIPNILRYHVFRADASNVKVMYVREYSTDSEETVVILKSTPIFDKTLLPSNSPKRIKLRKAMVLIRENTSIMSL